VWVGPVNFVQTDTWRLLKWAGGPASAAAESRVIPPGHALVLEAGTLLTLRLYDGSVVHGRFLGRALLDSTHYHPRFRAHSAEPLFDAPFALGETLLVSLREGRELIGAFAGYGELSLLLRSADVPDYVRVPFESARQFRRLNGDVIEPRSLTRAFRAQLLPSAEALLLGPYNSIRAAHDWISALRVPVEDIETVSAELPTGTSVAGVVILSVLVTLMIVFVILAEQGRSKPSCEPGIPPSLSGVHLTTRPFDRDRGCFVGEPLAVADPWPASSHDDVRPDHTTLMTADAP
jgi:hypothetical protein